jgi:putative tricarboxylic transport membrane protein
VRWGELFVCVWMALVAIGFYGLATFKQEVNPIDPGPAFYPRLVSLLLLVFSSVQIFRSWKGRDRSPSADGEPKRLWGGATLKFSLGTLVLSLIYVGVFDKMSYLVTTPTFLLALMLLGGVRRWRVLLGVALCYTLATYYLFGRLLMVPIP